MENKILETAAEKDTQDTFTELHELRKKLQIALDTIEAQRLEIIELKEFKNKSGVTTYSYE